MRENPLIIALVAWLGASGVMVVGGSALLPRGEGLPAEAGAAPRDVVAATSCEGDPVHGVLCDYFGERTVAKARARFRRTKSHVIIASLPDPLDSDMGFAFDQFLETIRLGAIAAGYQPDRFFLPWMPSRNHPKGDALADYSVELKHEQSDVGLDVKAEPYARRPKHRTHPGALLFRRRIDGQDPEREPSLLLVLLVGETPTFGADPRVIERAFGIARKLRSRFGAAEPARSILPVVAPVFSGAVEPLRREAKRFLSLRPATRLCFLTGTATSEASLSRLQIKHGGYPMVAPCGFSETGRAPAADVASFVDTAERGNEKLVEYLLSQAEGAVGDWGNPTTIALLHEADTPYGHDFLPAEHESRVELVALPYPMHVSQLWSAYVREGRAALGAPAQLDGGARRSLSLVPEPTGGPIDLPSPLRPATASNSAERVLTNLLLRVGQVDPEFVGILGTNVHDVIFLARMVNEYMPDAQLFTVGSDMLLTHPQHLQDLLGLRILSSSPPEQRSVLRGVKGSQPPPQEWLQLPASNLVGVYRAMLNAVCSIDTRADQRRCDMMPTPRWTASGGRNEQDGMWLTAVGRGSIWPLQLSKGSIPSSIRPPRYGLPGPFSLLVTGYMLFAGCVFLTYWENARKAERRYGVFRTVAWVGEAHCRGRALGVPAIALFVSLLAGGAYPIWVWTRRWAQSFRYEQLLMLVGVAVLGVGGIVLLLVCARELRFRRPRLGVSGYWVGLSSLFLVTLGAWFFSSPPSFPLPLRAIHDRILAQRAIHLSSGLSPIAPWAFLSAGLVVLSYALLRWDRLARQRETVAQVARFSSGARDLSNLTQGVWQAIACRWGLGPARAAGLVGSIVTFALLWRSRVITFDGATFGWCLSLAFAALLGGAGFLAANAFLFWRRLRRLLRALTLGPLGEAFGRVPDDFARTLGLRWSSEPAAASELRYDIDQGSLLRRLVNHEAVGGLGAWSPGDMPTFGDWQNRCASMDAELEKLSNKRGWPFAHETEAQGALSVAAGEVLGQLRVAWESAAAAPRGKSERSGEEDPGDVLTRQRQNRVKALRLAEEFVAVEACRFASYAFAHMKNYLTAAVIVVVLALLAAASYPFRPQHLLTNWILIEFFFIVGIAATLIVQIDRNELLSRIANRSPHRLDLDASFWGQMFTYVLLPVAALLVTQFPGLSEPLSGLFGALGLG